MHYKNGRPASIGDPVIKRNPDGTLVIGMVTSIIPGTSSCNLAVATHSRTDIGPGMCLTTFNPGTCASADADGKAHLFYPYVNTCQTASEFLHADDALKAFEKLEAALP